MLKRILSLLLFVNAGVSIAQSQYTESTCILLQNQIKEFSYNPHTLRYKSAKQTFDKHCIKPIKPKVEQSETITLAAKPQRSRLPSSTKNTGINRPQIAVSKPVINSNASQVFTDGLISLIFKVAIWLVALSFGLALLKALITLAAKRTAVKIAGRLKERVEPNIAQPYKPSLLKKTIQQIVAQDNGKEPGDQGEKVVNALIADIIKRNFLQGQHSFSYYKNILLTTDEDQLTEIDHLIVSPFAIFVIESKNYSGFIFGSEHQANWTQTLRGRKTQFMNPLRQNYKHCLAVSRLLGVTSGVESVVLFHNKAEIKTAMPKNVIYVSELEKLIASYSDKNFSLNQLAEFNHRIRSVQGVTTENDYQAHIDEVKATLAKK